jgi:hypothetical protein
MVRRVLFAIVWCVVLYFGTCIVIGGIAGGMATANLQEGQDAAAIGAQAGASVVGQYRPIIGLGAIALACVGSYFQFLPGTRKKLSSPE